MTLSTLAALIYAVCALSVVLFHIAMIAGAPWGHLTMGGAYPGRYRGVRKLLSVSQIVVIGAMATGVLGAAGLIPVGLPSWTVWLIVAVQGLSMLANGATPSAPERKLWLPITMVMFFCVLVIALGW